MSTVELLINRSNSNKIIYSIDPKYSNLLNSKADFSVLKPDSRFLPDTEKPLKTITINKKSFQKIFSLSNTNFIEFLSILEIVITKIRYEYFHSLLLTRSQYDPKLKRILNNIESYSMNGRTPISEYSIKKILHLAGFDDKDLPSFMNLKKLASLTKLEEKTRKKRIRRLSNKSSILQMNDLVKNWENKKFKILRKDDYSEKCDKQNLNDIDIQFKQVINKYNSTLKDIELKSKEYINEMENENKIYVPIEDKDNNKNYIRKDYINLIKDQLKNKQKNKKNLKVTFKEPTDSSDNEDNYYNIKNSNNEIIQIPKRRLENYINKGEELINIQSNNDEQTLCPIPKIKEALNNWKYLNQISNIPSRFPRNRWRKVQLINMTFPNQEEITNLPSKEEIQDIKNQFNNQLLNDINNNSLLEIDDNQFVNSNLINQILNDESGNDNFKVNEYLNKNPIDVSKKEIEKLNKDDNKKYIKLINKANGKKYIVNLKELNDKLENNSNLKEPIQLSNYKGKNFNIKPKDILIEKMDEKEKVYQPKKGEELNKKLEDDLKNSIPFKQIGKFLIPKKVIEDIKKDKSDINEFEVPAIENYSDNYFKPESKIKINKNDVEKYEQLPEFIEVNYINDNNEEKHNLISKKDLLNGINDNSKDEIKLKDFIGNDVDTNKSNLKIVNNINQEIKYDKEGSSKDYAEKLLKNLHENKEYQLIPDENKKMNLFDKSYINLVLSNNPKNNFDKYEIPNVKKDSVKVLKSDIQKLKDPKTFIKLFNKNNKEDNLILVDDLKNNHDELSDEYYLFNVYDKANKIPMKVKDLSISYDPKKIVYLPPQPEEVISHMRNRFIDPKIDIDIVEVKDIDDSPIFVFISEIEDKLEENKKNDKSRKNSSFDDSKIHKNSLDENNKDNINNNLNINDIYNNNNENKNNSNNIIEENNSNKESTNVSNIKNSEKSNNEIPYKIKIISPKDNYEINYEEPPKINHKKANTDVEIINSEENPNLRKESSDILNPFDMHSQKSNKEIIIDNIDLQDIEKSFPLKDIYGKEKEIKQSSIPDFHKSSFEINCMIKLGDGEILVNKKDLINLLIGEKSDIESLISDSIKKKPKEIDLLFRLRNKMRPQSLSDKFSRDILNNLTLPEEESKIGKSFRRKKKSSNLDSIIEDKNDNEDDNVINNSKNEEKENKEINNKENKKQSFEDKKKILSGYNSAPEDDKVFENFSDDEDEEFKIYNKHHKKNNLIFGKGVFKENENKNNKQFTRRETRSKSQIPKKLQSGIDYMLSLRKKKDIYNIRWKIVKQIIKKKKKYKK